MVMVQPRYTVSISSIQQWRQAMEAIGGGIFALFLLAYFGFLVFMVGLGIWFMVNVVGRLREIADHLAEISRELRQNREGQP